MLAQANHMASKKPEIAPERKAAPGEDGVDAYWWERVVRVISDSVDEDYETRAYPRKAPVVTPAPDPAPAPLSSSAAPSLPAATQPPPASSAIAPRANTNPPIPPNAKTKAPASPPARRPLHIRGVETTDGKPKPGASTLTQSPLMPLTPLPLSPAPATTTRGATDRAHAPKPAPKAAAPAAPDSGLGRRLFWFGTGVVVLGALAWWAWPALFSTKPAPARHAVAHAGEHTPAVIAPIAVAPATSTNQRAPTIAGLVAAEVGHSWDFGGHTSWDDPANPPKPPPVNLEAPPARRSTEPAPPVQPATKAAAEPLPPRPEPSSAFLERIGQFKINGVRPGNPVRAIINGDTFFSGDLVDPKLGLRFVGMDAGGRRLIFEDLNGARAGVEF